MKPSAIYLAPALLVATVIGARIALYAWRRRDIPGAVPLALMALGVAWWTGMDMLLLPFHKALLPSTRLAMEFIGVVALPPAWLAFSFHFTGRISRFNATFIWTAALFGSAIVLLMATNEHHHLAFSDHRPGPIYWLFSFYAYICVLWGLILMAQRMLELPAAYQVQFLVMISAGILPVICNILDDVVHPFKGWIDLMPFGFLLSAILVWHGLFRFRILDLLSVPQEMLMDIIRDGILVIDSQHRVLEYNKAAAELLPELTPKIIGQSAQPLPIWERIQELCQPGNVVAREISHIHKAEPMFLEVRSNRFLSHQGGYKGSLLLLHDVTSQRKAQKENEKLVHQLRAALGEVKTLTGLLPICSSCKRIRNKTGNWDRVERYLKENTDATLTHSLCPECAKSMFSDFS